MRLHLWWDTALSYMPLTLLSALLLLSIWLVRNAPEPPATAMLGPISHTPDLEFKQFTLKSYDSQGRLLSALVGKEAVQFQDTKVTVVQQPIVSVFSSSTFTQATAKQSFLNEDGTEVQLLGKATVTRIHLQSASPPETIRSEFLHFFSRTDRVVTHLPVVLTRGQDRLSGDGMVADNLTQVLQLKGRVRVQLHPEKTTVN
jgi:lipopolysaccharide export system protein LptC